MPFWASVSGNGPSKSCLLHLAHLDTRGALHGNHACPPPQDTTTSPGLLHSWETRLALGSKTAQATSNFAAERMKAWGQAAPATGEREGVELAGRAWCLLTPFLPLPRNCSPRIQGPVGVPIASLAIHQHTAYTRIGKGCFHPSFVIDLKP